VKQLTEMPADYRILSIHYGLERRVVPDERQLADWRAFAAEEKGILGHHPHVVQGVELNGRSLIFYGLGNFLHPGTAEMARFGMCRDYGLMAKIYFARVDGAWRVEAIEAIPLTNTQLKPERFASAEAEKRVYALNHLAAGLMTARAPRASASRRKLTAQGYIAPTTPPILAAKLPRSAKAGSTRQSRRRRLPTE
jgi:poly-gamma-glutamate capsule biosynthesis protein CapA/YwtB (metallophosphatase superfamily)